MPDKLPYEVYPSLNEKREILESFREEAIKTGREAISEIGCSRRVTDFVLMGFIKRSIDLVEGFTILLDDWNLVCAAPIVRMQLDSLLRLNYLSKLDNPYDISKRLFSGDQFDKIKDKDGKNLTDKYLREFAGKEFPWIADVYYETSKHIHFSNKHFFMSICNIDEEKHQIYIAIGNRSMHAKEEDCASYYNTMIKISENILTKVREIGAKRWD